jgi:hypothetical protein
LGFSPSTDLAPVTRRASAWLVAAAKHAGAAEASFGSPSTA